MRKNGFMIILIVVLIMCTILVVGGCGAHQAIPADDDGSVTASGDGENVIDGDEPDGSQTAEPGDAQNTESPDSTSGSEGTANQPADGTSAAPAGSTTVNKGEEPEDSDAPSKGDDRSILGIPDLIDTRTEDDGDLLVVVNKYHAVSKNYKPKDLVTIDDKYGTWKNMELKSVAYEAYKKLYKDAKAQGFDLKLCSAMRSYETQKTLYTNAVKNRGRATANIRSAYPGRSEHHTGLAIDVTSASMGWGLKQDFADYPDGQWINEHCQEYGFIIRYPKGKTNITGYDYEPWHLRYVGVEAATYIMENGLTLEEYVGQA